MVFKDLLLTLISYPEPMPVTAVDQAVTLAEAFGARISAISFELEVAVPGRVNFLADKLLDVPGIVAAERQKSLENARNLLKAFETSATRQGVFQERILERCMTSQLPDVLIEHARLHDLTIIPADASDGVWCSEAVIFGSGRPTMVLPAVSRPGWAPSIDTVAVAWDFSRAAARAVADALPILEKAKQVRVVTVTNEKIIKTSRSGAELARHLARHGVEITLDVVEAEGRSIGDALEAYIESHDVDLLVMGAYGHSRIREFILGGATLSMISRPPVPVFLSH